MMAKRFLATLVVLAGSIMPAHAAVSDIVRNSVAGFIVSGYERFAGEAALQASILDSLCTDPQIGTLTAARNQFASLVNSWSRIEIVRFGPVLDENRLERILFWPDRRSLGLRQVQSALASEDESVTSLAELQNKSVALQGLGALEYLLFGTGWEELAMADGSFRCRFAHTVSRALADVGEELMNDWLAEDGIATHMTAPGPQWNDYRSETEVLQELLGVWVHGAELMRDTRLRPFFAETPEDSNHKLALLWRSGQTIASLRANAAGLRDLFIVSGLAEELEETEQWAGGAFIFELRNFERTADEVALPIEEATYDLQARSKINYLLILTRSIQKLAVEQIAAELGLSVGFSALDGD